MSDVVTILDNRVSHWKLEEASGNRVDEETNGNDLNDLNTVTSATGIQGDGAFFVDANDERLIISSGDQTGMGITGDVSISCWVYLNTLPASGAEMWIASKYQGVAPRTGYGFGISNRSGSIGLVARAATISNGFSQCDSSTNGITTGTWYHIVIGIDVSTSEANFYVNGTSWGVVSLSASLGGSIATGSNSFVVGGQPNDVRESFDGIIDELTLTSDLITSGEVTSLYNSGSGVPYSGGSGPTSDIKSIYGTVQASIKSQYGILNANIKSKYGISN